MDTATIGALSAVLGSIVGGTEQYFAKNLPVEQIHHLALSKDSAPLKAFGQACCAELKAMRAGA